MKYPFFLFALMMCAGLISCACSDRHSPENDDNGSETAYAYRNAMTDIADWVANDSETNIRKRFELYKSMGVNVLRVEMHWYLETSENFWDNYAQFFKYIQWAKEYGFRIKLILGHVSNPPQWYRDRHPDAYLVSPDGDLAAGCISYWYDGFEELVKEKTVEMIQLLKDKDLWDCIDFVEPALGVAGEPIYPPTWTQSVKVPKFWCYGENAKADFRAEMQKKYKTLDAANSTWSSDFASWDDVTVLAPGELKGLYWYDVLTWYRDSKREKVLWMLDYTRSVLAGTGKRLVINVPGVQYTIDQWNEALNSSTGGTSNLMTMEDSDYLLDYACDTGEMIEYTGLTPGIENVEEIARIQKYIKDKGYEVDVWAENVGDEGTASRIDDLKDLVIGNKLYGFDYTHSIYLFESDKITVRQNRVDALTDLYAAVDELYNANK